MHVQNKIANGVVFFITNYLCLDVWKSENMDKTPKSLGPLCKATEK